jgi:hypothetical protein
MWTNVSQTRHVTLMQHVTTQKDLMHVCVTLDTVVMDFLAMVCTELK